MPASTNGGTEFAWKGHEEGQWEKRREEKRMREEKRGEEGEVEKRDADAAP